MIDNIESHLDKKAFQYKGSKAQGDLYEYVMSLTGANGKKANVCTGWINESGTNKLRLTSVYVTKKKVTKNE